MIDTNGIFSSEGLVISGVIDFVWGCGWRLPTSENFRNAEGCADRSSGLVLPKKAVISVFLRELPDMLSQIDKDGNSDGSYIVVVRDGDSTLSQTVGGLPSFVRHIFSVHTDSNERVTAMPFGLRWVDHAKSLHGLSERLPRTSKNSVLLAHRLLNWLPPDHERRTSLHALSNLPHVTTFLASGEAYPLTLDEYYEKLRQHDYFVSASGDNGGERQAMWEAMALGTIPICTRKAQARWSDMPVALVDSWSDVTLEWCQKNIEVLRSRSFEKMSLSYWVERVSKEAKRL